MDFLLDALGEIAAEVFGSVAHLLNLDLDIVFVDTTSTYWETETADELAELAEDPVDDDELTSPTEAGTRAFGHSKDHRADLPQVVIAMAVTRDGVPVRCWTFPGDTADTAIIRTSRTTWAGGGCAGWCGWPTAGSPPPPTGLPDPRWRALHPRREAAPHQHRGRRRAGPARAATAPSPTTCGSRKSRSPPAGTATATTAPAPSGS